MAARRVSLALCYQLTGELSPFGRTRYASGLFSCAAESGNMRGPVAMVIIAGFYREICGETQRACRYTLHAEDDVRPVARH